MPVANVRRCGTGNPGAREPWGRIRRLKPTPQGTGNPGARVPLRPDSQAEAYATLFGQPRSRGGTGDRLKPVLLSQAVYQANDVGGQAAFEVEFFARFRMHKAELGGMQGNTNRARAIDHLRAARCRVDSITAERMPALGEVDADLVRAAGLESAFDERVGVT